MITRENIKTILNEISKQEIERVMENKEDYVALQVYIFNAGYKVELNSIDPYTNEAEEIQANGGLVMDKDDLLRLFKETGSNNKHIKEYL